MAAVLKREDLEDYLTKHGAPAHDLAAGSLALQRSLPLLRRCAACASGRAREPEDAPGAAGIRALLKDCLNALLHELPQEPLPFIVDVRMLTLLLAIGAHAPPAATRCPRAPARAIPGTNPGQYPAPRSYPGTRVL